MNMEFEECYQKVEKKYTLLGYDILIHMKKEELRGIKAELEEAQEALKAEDIGHLLGMYGDLPLSLRVKNAILKTVRKELVEKYETKKDDIISFLKKKEEDDDGLPF